MKLKRTILAFALLLQPLSSQARIVTATVYDPWYAGRPVYCTGEPYEHWGISAAHPWLPCGTRVRVSYRGRTITVPIKDRCDCNSIDLSAGAAYFLGIPLDDIRDVDINY